MFGRGRTQVGVLIEPAHHIDVGDHAAVETFKDDIWPDIVRANAFGPSHSRIVRELVLIVDSKANPFMRTAKGTVARNAIYLQNSDAINNLYDAERTTADWAQPPEQWNDTHIRSFVVRLVNAVMREASKDAGQLDESRDLFEQGCDSLQAIYIANAIRNVLRQAPPSLGVDASRVGKNIVFTHPTIRQLGDFVVSALHNESVDDADDPEGEQRRVAVLLNMVQKYSPSARGPRTYSDPSAQENSLNGHVVLLTGSTGMLGTYLLNALLLDPQVARVYALNRSSRAGTLLERQSAAFLDRAVNLDLLRSPKLRLIEADTDREDLGVDDAVLHELRSSVTAIIHNAWRLDFNLSLSSFEPHVRATRNLIDLALSSKLPKYPQFVFTSSVGAVANWSAQTAVPEEPIDDPKVALGNGYGASKWVAERVLAAASEKLGLRTTIWRIGQLTGSTLNGAWSTSDWVPIVIKASQGMKNLPSMDAHVSWLPTNKAADAIVEVLHVESVGTRTLHLVHPRPVPWDVIFSGIGRALGVPRIPYAQWYSQVEILAKTDPRAIDSNPAVKLLDFLRGGIGAGSEGHEAMGVPCLDTVKATKASSTLAELPEIGEVDVQKWMQYWWKHGLLV